MISIPETSGQMSASGLSARTKPDLVMPGGSFIKRAESISSSRGNEWLAQLRGGRGSSFILKESLFSRHIQRRSNKSHTCLFLLLFFFNDTAAKRGM